MSMPKRIKLDYENGIVFSEARKMTHEELVVYANQKIAEMRDTRNRAYLYLILVFLGLMVGFLIQLIPIQGQ